MKWDIQGKVVLITGATDGIGRAVLEELSARGARIYLTSRSIERGEEVADAARRKSGNQDIFVLECDLASLASVRHCAEIFKSKESSLHVLINNAGVMPVEYQESKEGFELNMAVNYLAHFLLTYLLLPTIKNSAPARIINVASSAHRQALLDPSHLVMTKDEYLRYRAYANSKLALILFARHLARELEGSGVVANAVHPGWIRTKLALGSVGRRNPLARALLPFTKMSSPKRGALGILHLATSPEASYSGKYYSGGGLSTPSSDAQNDTLMEALVARSKEILANYF